MSFKNPDRLKKKKNAKKVIYAPKFTNKAVAEKKQKEKPKEKPKPEV